MPRPLYPGGRTPVPTEQKAGWAPEPVWSFNTNTSTCNNANNVSSNLQQRFSNWAPRNPTVSQRGCVGFRQTEMHNGGRVLLAVLNSYARIEIRVVTFDINHSVTDSTQSVNGSFNPEAS